MRGLLREAIVFSSFRNLRKLLLAICFVQWQCSPNQTFLAYLRYFRRQSYFEGCLYFLRTLVYRSQTARKTFHKGFLVISFPFSRFSLSKTSFFAGLSPSKFAYPLQKYPFYTERFGHLWYEISDWYDPYIFFIRIATGSTSDSHPLSVNARPIWIKIYPTLYLSDSHPLSVNLA